MSADCRPYQLRPMAHAARPHCAGVHPARGGSVHVACRIDGVALSVCRRLSCTASSSDAQLRAWWG